jgi:thiol:disulfide interchange protein DsbA
MLKTSLLALAFAAAALTSLSFAPQSLAQGRPPVQGKDFIEVSPAQNTETGDKNEVVEFFWYRCPHCYSLEPVLESWVKKLPADTQFRRVPAVFNEEWALDARIFYALDSIGMLEKVHRGMFDHIHKGGGAGLKGPVYMKFIAEWLAKQGVDMAKYDAALRSFTVETRLKRAMQAAQAYKLDGVPALAVNGRYLVSASMVSERQAMIDITDRLLAATRKPGVAKK